MLDAEGHDVSRCCDITRCGDICGSCKEAMPNKASGRDCLSICCNIESRGYTLTHSYLRRFAGKERAEGRKGVHEIGWKRQKQSKGKHKRTHV